MVRRLRNYFFLSHSNENIVLDYARLTVNICDNVFELRDRFRNKDSNEDERELNVSTCASTFHQKKIWASDA